MDNYTIEQMRSYIDDIDETILNMLNSRFDICKMIGEKKRQLGMETVYVPEREQAIINRLSEREHHEGLVQAIWPTIMEYSRSLQKNSQ